MAAPPRPASSMSHAMGVTTGYDDVRKPVPPFVRTRIPLAALYAANAISWTGNTLTFLAVPWFVLATTGSAARTGVVGFTIGAATVVAAFLTGPWIDRVGARRMSIAA